MIEVGDQVGPAHGVEAFVQLWGAGLDLEALEVLGEDTDPAFAARAAVRPGISFAALDAAAREMRRSASSRAPRPA